MKFEKPTNQRRAFNLICLLRMLSLVLFVDSIAVVVKRKNDPVA